MTAHHLTTAWTQNGIRKTLRGELMIVTWEGAPIGLLAWALTCSAAESPSSFRLWWHLAHGLP